MKIADRDADGNLRKLPTIENTGTGRAIAEDVVVDGKTIAAVNADTTDVLIERLVEAGVDDVRYVQRADLRVQGRRLRHVLRPLAGHRQAGRRRRGGRHRRRPVHR